MIEIILNGTWKEYLNLVMMLLATVYFMALAYIFGSAIWKWASEPYRITNCDFVTSELEKEIENNN